MAAVAQTRDAPTAAQARRQRILTIAMIVACALLIGDALWIARTCGGVWDGPCFSITRGGSLLNMQPYMETVAPSVDVSRLYERDEDGFIHLYDIDQQSADELTRLMMNEPIGLFAVRFVRKVTRRGSWAPTLERVEQRVILQGWGKQAELSDRERDVLISAMAADLAAAGEKELARLVPRGSLTETRWLWTGIAHNVIAAGLLLFAFISFYSLSCSGWAEWRAFRKLSRGVCPECGYDMSSVRTSDGFWRCPECGLGWRGWTLG